jgi:acyl carrier protein
MSGSEAEVRGVLSSIVGPEVADALGDDELIFERGVVDSMHLVELVSAFESRFGFVVEGDELTPENFASIHAMSSYVNRKTQG